MRRRKSPIRHRVKSHTRKGRPVHSYMRGHGKPIIRKRRLILATARVKQNPGAVDITALRSPITGAPLEPPLEYGKTIAYDPYSHSFHYVTPEGETERVTPRFTQIHQRELALTKSHIFEAEKAAKERNLEKSVRKLWDAIMVHRTRYPGARLHMDPVYTELSNAYNEARNMYMSGGGAKGGRAGYFTDRGLSRVLASAHAVRQATERQPV